jgi:hypothetical protein
MHLIAVRRDLAHFAHEHPAQDGSDFRLRFTFPSGGDYRVFADVAPKGAGSQILMAKLKVGGPETPETARHAPGSKCRPAARCARDRARPWSSASRTPPASSLT